MEQRALVETAGLEIFNHQRAGRQRRRQIAVLEQLRRQHPRARSLRPDRGEMGFARSFRPDQRHHAVRPIRPALDQRQRRRVRRAGQEILARKACRHDRARARAGAARQNCRCRSTRALAGIERALPVAAQAQSAPARRSWPPSAPPPAGRQSRTDSRRRAARRSARPDAGRRFRRPAWATARLPSRNWPTRKMPSTVRIERVVRPELRHRDADRQHQPGHRADIGNEGDQPGNQPDQQAEIKPAQRQRHRIERAEDQADRGLPAHEAGDGRVDLARELAHGVALVARDPARRRCAIMRCQS